MYSLITGGINRACAIYTALKEDSCLADYCRVAWVAQAHPKFGLLPMFKGCFVTRQPRYLKPVKIKKNENMLMLSDQSGLCAVWMIKAPHQIVINQDSDRTLGMPKLIGHCGSPVPEGSFCCDEAHKVIADFIMV